MARKNDNTDRILRDSRAQAGIERDEYFKRPGATVAGWRGGRSNVYTDRKKQASKKACRGRVRE